MDILYVVLYKFFGLIFGMFIYLVEKIEVYMVIEILSIRLIFIYWTASTKEAISRFTYLMSFRIIIGSAFILDIVWSYRSLNMYLFVTIISVRVVIFLSKLPIFYLHYWLTKAHVEIVTIGSAILRSLMLKMRFSSFSFLMEEIILALVICLLPCFCILRTIDFKIWVAYSSILHITVYRIRAILFHIFISDLYLIPHTLISRIIFFFLRSVYSVIRTRILNYIFYRIIRTLVLFWVRLPILSLFLVEISYFLIFFRSLNITIFWFVNFIIFLEIRLSFLSKSVYRSLKRFFKSNYLLEIIFCVVICWIFL